MIRRNPNEDFRAFEIMLPPEPVSTIPRVEYSKADVERLEGFFLGLSRQGALLECSMPLTHRFQPGVYLREILMPRGAFVIGHEHTKEHFNLVISGSGVVLMDNQFIEAEAGMCIRSLAGVRKILFITEAMRWMTIHANLNGYGIQQIEELEKEIIVPSEAFLDHKAEVEKLRVSAMQTLDHETHS